MSATDTQVQLSKDASTLAVRGRPWFYADELRGAQLDRPGLVQVVDHAGRGLGLGFFSPRSKIRLRRCGAWAGDALPDPDRFFGVRLAAALAARQPLLEELGAAPGLRLVHGEGDLLPGLVVDRYADCLVLQSTSAVIEAHLASIVPSLVGRCGARSVLARNDVGVRGFEGLPQEVRLLHGSRVESVTIEEYGIRHEIDLYGGQKTGFYLDQRPARQWLATQVRRRTGPVRVLDLFSYQGGFALSALRGMGAKGDGQQGEVVAVDQSEAALQRAREAAERNDLTGLRTECGNAFDVLKALRDAGERFDFIVCDPPAFAKSRREVRGATRGYRELNRHALRLLQPGGYLLTCSCSHHITLPNFEGLLRQATASLPFAVLLRSRLAAGADHPVWLSLPESEYLKSFVLQRAPEA